VRHLGLPFERLVRNVWEEGPEVLYDRQKEVIDKLLSREVERRAERARAPPPRAPRPPTVSTLGEDLANLVTAGKPHKGTRLGLLTFHGKPHAPKRAPKPFGT
jgi:hypothetical protein